MPCSASPVRPHVCRRLVPLRLPVVVLGLLVLGTLAGCERAPAAPPGPLPIPHVVLETETIRAGNDGAYRLRVEVARYPASQDEFERVVEALVAEHRHQACVLHMHVYGPGVYHRSYSDVGNAVWGPPDGLGFMHCQRPERGFRSLEFLGAVPTIMPTIRLGTARHAGAFLLPDGARRVRRSRNRNGQYATYALPGVSQAELLSLYRLEMSKRGWTLTGLYGPTIVGFRQGDGLGFVEWKPDSMYVGYEPQGARDE